VVFDREKWGEECLPAWGEISPLIPDDGVLPAS